MTGYVEKYFKDADASDETTVVQVVNGQEIDDVYCILVIGP